MTESLGAWEGLGRPPGREERLGKSLALPSPQAGPVLTLPAPREPVTAAVGGGGWGQAPPLKRAYLLFWFKEEPIGPSGREGPV